MKNGAITDYTRIDGALPTLKYLLEKKTMTHSDSVFSCHTNEKDSLLKIQYSLNKDTGFNGD